MSQFVFHNPPMPAARVAETMQSLDAVGVRAVVIGGWGIDALVGRELRMHRDLDVMVATGDFDSALAALEGMGYERWHCDEAPEPLGRVELSRTQALRDCALRVVDLHGGNLDRLELSRGEVFARPVTCISANQQLEAQVGRTWSRARRMQRRVNVQAIRGVIGGE
ncbi:MAG: hypothetical protein AB7G65_05335 [Thermoleophilia bacterium]